MAEFQNEFCSRVEPSTRRAESEHGTTGQPEGRFASKQDVVGERPPFWKVGQTDRSRSVGRVSVRAGTIPSIAGLLFHPPGLVSGRPNLISFLKPAAVSSAACSTTPVQPIKRRCSTPSNDLEFSRRSRRMSRSPRPTTGSRFCQIGLATAPASSRDSYAETGSATRRCELWFWPRVAGG
jgi:hypothetical protein